MTAHAIRSRFDRALAQFGPFEPRPLLAVAVSGGADSTALALLADGWARARRGRVIALTVDHGLRSEARAEARRVGRWLAARGIAHRVLRWIGPKPNSGVQAAARAARYRLLEEFCGENGILHLLLGHTRDDQAETVLLRLAAGSGPLGLAGMPTIRELQRARLLRPLLDIAHSELTEFLRAKRQPWIEDSSNLDPRFARVRIRARLDVVTAGKIASAAKELGRFRANEEYAAANLLARAVRLHPEGYAMLDCAPLAAVPVDRARRALAALLATLGGREFPPGGDDVRKLLAAMAGGRLRSGRTLGGCRLIPKGEACLVVRETRGLETTRLRGETTIWDGRFVVSGPPGATVGPLGEARWAEAVALAPALRLAAMPYAVRLSLPAIRDRGGLLAVPGLGFVRGMGASRKKTANARFLPGRTLAPAVFAASPPSRVALEGEASPVV